MKIFYTESHRAHNPSFEIIEGGERVPYLENADRMDRIRAALGSRSWAEFVTPGENELPPIAAVHDSGYLTFLATGWGEWQETHPSSINTVDIPALLPATFVLRRSAIPPRNVLAKAGYYMMDLSAPIVEGTYTASLASANCALRAAQSVFDKSKNAFALTRPPGHHAGVDYAAGYCFINNAAVGANWLADRGRTAILDIDYHAANGTQEIFYNRDDVLTISIHADPAFEYPHFTGHASETGAGRGLGFHRNFPLPKGTTDYNYLSTLEQALNLIRGFGPKYLVLSVGMDTFGGDPLGKFNLTRSGFKEIGRRIASLALPTTLIMEGGYANEELGENLVSLLENFK